MPSARSERTIDREEENRTFTSNFPMLQEPQEKIQEKIKPLDVGARLSLMQTTAGQQPF